MSALESTNVEVSKVFRVCVREISWTGILMDFGDKDTRTGEMVVVDCRQRNIWLIESARGDV